jgi:acyl dehydratase
MTGFIEGTVIAFREIISWKFSKPVFIGDTIRVEIEVIKKKAVPRLGGGSVVYKLTVFNQNDEVVQRGNWNALIHNKPED